MRAVILTYSNDFTLELAIELIPKSIETVEANDEKEALEFLNFNNDIHILITEVSVLEFLKKAKSIKPKLYIFMIYHKNFKPKDMMAFMNIGITGLIEYSESSSTVCDLIIQSIFQNGIKVNEQRKHIRIFPSPYEKLTASVYIKTINRFVKGTLLDISAGGIALKLDDTLDASILTKHNIYDPLILHIRGMEVKTISRLMSKQADKVGFRFENVEEIQMHKIATYIHMRIRENSKKQISNLMNTNFNN